MHRMPARLTALVKGHFIWHSQTTCSQLALLSTTSRGIPFLLSSEAPTAPEHLFQHSVLTLLGNFFARLLMDSVADAFTRWRLLYACICGCCLYMQPSECTLNRHMFSGGRVAFAPALLCRFCLLAADFHAGAYEKSLFDISTYEVSKSS